MCYRSGKYTVCRRFSASLSPEILQAGAVKGLILDRNETRESAVCSRLGGRESGGEVHIVAFFSTNVLLVQTQQSVHTPSIAFRHLSPNSARFSYATEGALFISAQLSGDAVSALRKVPVLI